MPLEIVIIGGSNNQPAQVSADFFGMWADRFATEVVKPDPWDWVAAGASAYTGGIGALAAKGFTREAALATSNAYQFGVEIPFTVGMAIPAVANGSVQSNEAGFFREVAGVAAGTAAGLITVKASAVIATGIATIFPPAAPFVIGIGILASVGMAYSAGKLTTTGIDSFNQWLSDAANTNQQIVQTLPSGGTVTINPDRSYAIAQNGNVYSYDSSGDLSSTYIANRGISIDIDKQTGTMTARDSTGSTIAATRVQTDETGSLTLIDATNNQSLGTLSKDINGGYQIADTAGNQLVVPPRKVANLFLQFKQIAMAQSHGLSTVRMGKPPFPIRSAAAWTGRAY